MPGSYCKTRDIGGLMVQRHLSASKQPVKGNIARIARLICCGRAVKLFTTSIAQRVGNTGRRVAFGRWLLLTAAVAAKKKWFHRHRRFPV